MTTPQGDLPDYLPTVGATVGLAWTGALAAGATEFIDVAQYNSLLVTIQDNSPGVPIACTYRWVDQFTARVVDAGLLSANITVAPGSVFGPSWTLPVQAGQLQLINSGASNLTVEVIGQPSLSDWRMNFDGDPARPFVLQIAASAPANTVIPFASNLVGPSGPPYFPSATCFNGEVTLSLTTAAGTNGAVEAVWPDSGGNPNSTPLLIDPGGGARSQLVTHPRAFCTWQYRLSAAAPAAAHNALLSVTPS